MSATSSNPRRTPMTGRDRNSNGNVLSLKTTSLRKGATFHSPSSPSSGVSSLRRSQTTLEDVVDAHRRHMAMTIDDISQTLSGTASTSSRPSFLRDNSAPVPQGLVSLDPTLEDMMAKKSVTQNEETRRVLRSRTARQPSDSGIGSSIITTPQKRAGSSVSKKATATATAITRSAAASDAKAGLSPKAFSRITEHILTPLLTNPSFKDFKPILDDVPKKMNDKDIACLRDLEKTLIYMAPDKAKTASLYLDFCLASAALIQANVEHLSERDLVQPKDRPYSNGYFLDLCDQIQHYAARLAAKEKTAEDSPSSNFEISDSIRMYGGIAVNGREAELIRVTKDGKAFSLRDNRLIEDFNEDPLDPPRFKRSHSQSLEDEEEIRRSMARRKKNPTPEELAPKVCKHPGCKKQFARPCDLTKHEKTHSRPWKCPDETCKYHKLGWPTEKEMDRHYNDKHASNPHFFSCKFTPCPYKSKRESNCKQHMEKAHGWKYDRTKHNGKKDSIGMSSANPTPIIPSLPTPNSEQAFGGSPQSFFPMGHGQVDPILIPDAGFGAQFGGQSDPFPVDIDMDLDLLSPVAVSPVVDNGTPSTDLSSESLFDFNNNGMPLGEDIYSNNAQVPPTPSHDFLQGLFPATDMPLFPTGPIQFQPQPKQQRPLGISPVPIAQQQMKAQVQPQPHISPLGHGSQMLFTPTSMKDVDEGFADDFSPECNGDFTLFPDAVKPSCTDIDMNSNMFTDLPTGTNLYTQAAAQDFSLDPLAATNLESMDLSMDWMYSFGQ